MPKEPTISVADQPVEPQPSARSRWLPERLAATLGPLGRVPRPALAGLLALVLAIGLLAVHEATAAGEVRRGVRVGGVELSGLSRAAATDRLRVAARDIQASALTLRAGDASLRLARSRAGVELDVEATVAAAMAVGHGGPFDLDRFKGWFSRIDVPWKARLAGARLDKQLAVLDTKVGSEVREPTLRIGGRTLAAGSGAGAGAGAAGAGQGAGTTTGAAPGAGAAAGAGAVAVEVVEGRPGRRSPCRSPSGPPASAPRRPGRPPTGRPAC